MHAILGNNTTALIVGRLLGGVSAYKLVHEKVTACNAGHRYRGKTDYTRIDQ